MATGGVDRYRLIALTGYMFGVLLTGGCIKYNSPFETVTIEKGTFGGEEGGNLRGKG